METNNATIAANYYNFMGEKDVEGMKKYLHPDVEFFAPLATLKGKEAVVESISNFANMIGSLSVRAKFGTEDQALIVYDLDIPGVGEKLPSASLLNFRDGLIVRIELFYDARPYVK